MNTHTVYTRSITVYNAKINTVKDKYLNVHYFVSNYLIELSFTGIM